MAVPSIPINANLVFTIASQRRVAIRVMHAIVAMASMNLSSERSVKGGRKMSDSCIRPGLQRNEGQKNRTQKQKLELDR